MIKFLNNISIFIFLFLGLNVYSQSLTGLENFTNLNVSSSYSDGSFVGNSSISWTYIASRNANGDANNSGISLPALMLRRSASGSKVTSSTITGGVSDFSIKLYKGFTSGGNRQVELFINGVSKGTSTPFDDFSEHVFTVSGINVSGGIIIEITNITSKQVIIDDISWTGYSPPTTTTTTVPDDNFEDYLETHDASGNIVSVGDSNSMGDGIANNNLVTTANISGVTDLNVSYQNITDLTGIKYFTSITDLNCSDNQISSINLTLNGLLKYLKCDNNQLSTIDLTQNGLLEYLECDYNQLSIINTSQNTSLTHLYCDNNSISTLDLSLNTSLERLVCDNNQLSSLGLTQNVALISLLCDYNNLTALALYNNTSLENLNCSNNQLSSLDLSQNTSLQSFYCQNNLMSTLDLTNLTNLNTFDCGVNQLNTLNIKSGQNSSFSGYFNTVGNPDLICINVDDVTWSITNWTNIDAHTSFSNDCGGFENFTNLNVTSSYSDGSFVGNSSISWTYIDSRNANGDANNSGISLPALMLRRSASGSKITSSTINSGISDFSVKLYKGFSSGGNRQVELFINGVSKGTSSPFDDYSEHVFTVSGINVSGDIIIEIVNITSKQVIIDDISWTGHSPPTTIVPDDNFEAYLETHTAAGAVVSVGNANSMGDGIANNNLVNTANISGVIRINLQNQNIADLTGIEDFTSLTLLNCYDNQLSLLDVSAISPLATLSCYNNQISSLDLTQNINLTYLRCESNQLTSLDLTNNTSLNYFYCDNNQLSALDLSNNNGLIRLSAATNQLTFLTVSNMPNLNELFCQNNQLLNLDVRTGNNTSMSIFKAHNNPNLICISVDDANWATTNWTTANGNIDAQTSFSNDCNLDAEFTSNVTTVCEGILISFTDGSTSTATAWSWDFGDGSSSTFQNPTHTYTSAGTYNVSLTITAAGNTDTETKTGYIIVSPNEDATFAYSSNSICKEPSPYVYRESFVGSTHTGNLSEVGWTSSSGAYKLFKADQWGDIANTQDGDNWRSGKHVDGESALITILTNEFPIDNSKRTGLHFYVDYASNVGRGFQWVVKVNGVLYYSDYFGTTQHGSISSNRYVSSWQKNILIDVQSSNWNGGALPSGDITDFGIRLNNNNNLNAFAIDNFRASIGTVNFSNPQTYLPSQITTSGGIFSSSSNNLIIDSSTGKIDLDYSIPGTYTVSYLTNGNCPNSSTQNITVGQKVSVTIDSTVCNSINWGGNLITSSGAYPNTIVKSDGCDSTITLNLTVNPSPTVSAGNDQTVCQGNSVTLSGSGANSYSWNNGVSNATAFIPTVNTSGSDLPWGPLTVNNTTKNIAVNSSELVSLIINHADVNPNGYGYVKFTYDDGNVDEFRFWGNGGMSLWNPQTSTFTTRNYTVGNHSTSFMNIANTSKQYYIECLTTSGINKWEFRNLNTGLVGIELFDNASWNGLSNVKISQLYYVNNYTVTGTNANGCSANDDVTVSTQPLPSVNLGNDTTICNGNTITLDAGSGFSSYLWSTGAATQTIGVNSTGNHSVIVTNSNNCSATDSVNILQEIVNVSAGSDFSLCSGESVILNAGDIAFRPNYTFNSPSTNSASEYYSSGDLFFDNYGIDEIDFGSSFITIFFNDATSMSNWRGVNNTVSLYGLNANLSWEGVHTFSQSVEYSVNNNFNYIHYQPSTLSSQQLNDLSGFLASAGTGNSVMTISINLNSSGVVYTWDNGIVDGNSFTPSSTNTYTVTATGPNGCSSADNITISIIPSPTVSAGADQTVCAGTSVTLSGSGALTYSWNGTSDGVAFTPTTTATYRVVGTATNGCTDSDSVIVTVNTLPALSAGADQTVCAGTSITLSGSGAANYSWSNGISDGVAFTPTATTTYTLTGTDAIGCSTSDQVDIIVNTLPTVSAGNDQTVCSGSSVTLNGSSSSPSTINITTSGGIYGSEKWVSITTGINGSGSFIWGQNGCTSYIFSYCRGFINEDISISPGTYYVNCYDSFGDGWDGTSISVTSNGNVLASGNPGNISGNLEESYQITVPGIYNWSNGISNGVAFIPTTTNTYTVTGTDTFGCSATDNVLVTVNPQDDATFTYSASSYCADDSNPMPTISGTTGGTFTANSAGLNIVADTGLIDLDASTAGTYTVTYTTTGVCSAISTKDVTLKTSPTVDLGNDVSLCAGDITLLDAGAGHTNYLWNTGETTQTIYADTAGTYTVTVEDGYNFNSLEFNDFSEYIDFGDYEFFDNATSFTVSFWIKFNEFNLDQWIIKKGPTGTTNQIQVWADKSGAYSNRQNTISALVTSNTNSVYRIEGSDNLISDTDWHNITIVFNGTNSNHLKLYFDGVLDNNNQVTGGQVNQLKSTSFNFTINEGSGGNDESKNNITNLQIWSNVLVQSEIQQYMSSPPTGNEAGLVGYWNFNEGSGIILTDLSGNGNNGTINGASWSSDAPSQYANNCTATDDIVVTLNPQDDATFAYSASSYCADDSDPNPVNPTPIISGTSGGVFSSTVGLSINSSTGQLDLDTSTPGTYTITYTTPGANCFATSTQNLTINTLPTIDLGADTLLICDNTSQTLDPGTGFNSYLWNDGSTNQTLSASNSGTYTVIGTDANGCTASDSMVLDVLNVDITLNDTTICSGDSLMLSALDLENGKVGFWSFDGNANDQSGNGNNGTVYGASLAQDRLGNNNSAYKFQVNLGSWGSAQDRIVVSNPSIGNNNSFTMSSWVYLETKPSSFANRPHTIMGRWNGNGTSVFRHQIDYDGTLSTNLLQGSNSNTFASVSINYNEWKHIVISYDGTTLRHFIDGEKVGEQVLNFQINSSSSDLTFGELHMGNGHWYLFSGYMDELGYWNRALTTQEISNLYSSSPNYSYNWSPTNQTTSSITVSPTTTTSYTLDVTSGSTTCQDIVIVTVDALPVIDLGNDTTICNNGSIVLNAGSGDTFLWSNNSTNQTLTATATGNYDVTVTNTSGCSSTDNINVTIAPSLTVSVSGTNVICNGLNNGTASVTGGNSTNRYLWSDGQTTATATNLSPGNYTVTVTANNNCQSTGTVTISEPALLSATTQQPPQFADFTYIGEYLNNYIYYHSGNLNWTTARQKCLNYGGDLLVIHNAVEQAFYGSILQSNSWIGLYQDVNDPNYSEPSGGWKWVDGTPANYTNWDANEPNNFFGTSDPENYGHFTGGNHTWNDHNSNYSVGFTMQLDKSAANILSVTCNGGSNGKTYVTGAGGTLPYNYLWNDALLQTTDTAINLAPGTYTVTITDSNGCTASDTSIITEPSVIVGKDVQFSCDLFTWIDGNTYTASDSTATHTLTANNGCDSIVTLDLTLNYNNASTDVLVACDTFTWIDGITYSASNNTANYMLPTKGGCDSLVTLNLIINNSPIVDLGNDSTICANTTLNLDAGNGFTYLWSDATTNQTLTASTTGEYSVTITDGNGCENSDTISVTISSPLVLNFDSDSVICNGQNDGNATVIVTGGTPNYSYLWDDVNAQTTATATNLPAGSYSVTITDDNNCTENGNITVIEPSELSVSASILNSVSCNGGSDGTATVTVTGGNFPYSYLWSDGQTTQTSTNLQPGTYDVIITDDNNCIETGNNIFISEPAEITATDNQKECDTFTWIDGNTYTSSNNTATHILTSANGCDSIITLDLTINNSPSFTLANTSTQDSVCLGQSTVIYPSLGFNSSNPNYSFKWFPSNGLSSDSVHAPIVNVNVNTLYTLTVTDSNECISSDSIQIYVLPLPTVDAGVDKDICIGDSTTLNIFGNDTYSWDQGVTNGVSFFPLTTNDYIVTATNDFGCFNKDTVKISVNDLPIFTLTQDTLTACNIDSILVDAGSGYNLYAWNNGANTQQIYAVNSGTYSVSVTDANGCTASDDVAVDILNVDIVQNDTSICLGASITLDATSNFPAFNITQSMHLVPSEYASIQLAIDAATNGDTIYVSSGTYVENINYNNKDLYLLGEDREATIIDGNQNGSVVTMNGNSVINGFTIQNGTGTLIGTITFGGGININSNSNSFDTIINCIIQNNNLQSNLDSRGGGISANNNTHIIDCIIRNNSVSQYGGGVKAGNITRCEFHNNFPSGFRPSINSTIIGNIFSNNNHAIEVDHVDSLIATNNTFINNYSSIYSINSLGNIFTNSIFFNNTNVILFWNTNSSSYSDLIIDYSIINQNDNLILNNSYGQLNNGNNNISLAPQFVDTANGNFNLALSSPGVDAGNPDLNGNGILWQNDPEDQDPDGTRIDMGYGYTAQGPLINFSSPLLNNTTGDVTYAWSTGETSPTISPTPTVSTTYFVTLNNGINSCQDSVRVNVLPTSTFAIDTVVCDSMLFAGNNITTSGTYYDTLLNAVGCDSVVTLNLTIHNSITTNDSEVGCDSAVWNGNVYNTTGIYVDTLQTVNGCDSVVTMDLTINYSFYADQSITACDSMTWAVNGTTYTQSGIYYDSLQTIVGCDSVYMLDLTINPSPVFSFSQDTIGACGGDSVLLDAGNGNANYLWNTGDTNQTIYASNSGIYSVTIGDGQLPNVNNSLSFDGTDDRVVITCNNLPGGNSARSLSAWFYPESGFGNILAYGDGTVGSRRFSLLMDNGYVQFIGESNDHFYRSVTLNQWHFITVTYANNELKMYIDGALTDSTLLGTNLNTDNSYPLVIGSNTTTRNDEYFDGKVAQVSIWDRVLNATDVQNHMNCPPSMNAMGLLGYWELGNNANDATAYGNNGVIQGALISTEAPIFTCNNQNSCSTTDSIYVEILDVNIVQNDTSICEGDSIELSVVSNSGAEGSSDLGGSLNNGLVAYYPFNGNANDESGNGNNLTAYDNATLTENRFGDSNSAYILDGDNDYLASSDTFYNAGIDHSISIWVNFNSFSSTGTPVTDRCFLQTYPNTNHAIEAWTYNSSETNNSNSAGYFGNGSTWHNPNPNPTITEYDQNLNQFVWHNWILVNSGNIWKIYLDGNEVHQYISTQNPLNKNVGIMFGAMCGGPNWPDWEINGKLDDIGIWNRALTSQEIQELYNSQSNHSYSWSNGEITETIYVAPSQTTTYYVTANNGISSCQDSVTVNVLPTSALAIDTTACDSVFFAGGFVSSNGTYIDTLSNTMGCDSIVTLNLTINNSISTNDNLVACDSAEWNGNTYTSTGIYIDTLSTNNGCDSIVTMDMTIYYSATETDSLFACDSAEWNGNIYTTTGIYIDTLSTINGCDSIVTMDMTIYYSTIGIDSLFACDSAEWNGNIYTSTGIYVDTLSTINGCDSIVTMDMTINYSVTETDSLFACDSAEWNGNIYTLTGIYIDTLSTINGCDSIVTMDMTIYYSATETDSLFACDSAEWNGNIYTSTGIYVDTLSTINGCDSIVTMDMTINYSVSGIDSLFACDSAEWNGNIYTTTGIYVDTLSTINGCDSIVTMDMTIYYSTTGIDSLFACDSAEWNGNIFYTSGIIVDTLQTLSGCDSVVSMDMTISYSTTSSDFLTFCDSAEWNGNTYTLTGLYIDTLQTFSGCDSIVTLNLTINNSVVNNYNLVSCDSAEWNGNVYTSSGIYVDSLQTISGCDSILIMDLTVNYNVFTNDSLVVCDSAEWNGNIYTATGIYTDTLSTISGCDSIVTMNLTINRSNFSFDTLTAYDVLTWNGNLYDSSGSFIDTLQNNNGCDSIVTLDLTIFYTVFSADSLFECDSAEWNGNIYTNSGTFIDTLATINGADSIVTMDITIYNSTFSSEINSACDSILWNGNIYNSSGVYLDTLQSTNGCDSVVSLYLTINSSKISNESQVACNEYTWNGITFNSTGIYIDTLQTTAGCDSVATLDLTINFSSPLSAGSNTTICYGESITLNALGTGSVTWNNGVTDGQSFTADSTKIYIAQLTNNFGCISIDTTLITVLSLPIIDAGINQDICLEDSIQLIGFGADSLNWFHPGLNIYDSIYLSLNQTSTFYLNGVDSNGCSSNDSITITVNSLPNISIDSISTVCYGDAITLNAQGGVIYNWTGGFNNNSNIIPDSSQWYFVSVINGNQCQKTDSVFAQVYDAPIINAGNDTSICLFDSITLSATGNALSYNWTNNVIDGIPFVPSVSNKYVVSATNLNSCVNYDTIQIDLIILSVDAGGNQVLCTGDSAILNGIGLNPTWSSGVLDGVPFYPNISSEYILTISDSNGCVRKDTTIIDLFDLPNIKAPEDTTLCLGEEIQLFGSGAQTYLWNNGYFDGELLSPDYSSFYILTGIDSNGCRNFDTTYIEVTENPVISYTTTSVIYGNDATIMVYISGGTPWKDCGGLEPCQEPYLYDWDIDGLGDVDDQLHQFYLNSGSYFLTIYDSLSCSDTSTITVKGNFQIFVPDAVTPNADGINDTWDILGINNYPNASIKVFNIQGQIIFEHNNSNDGDFQPWPATFSDGQALPASDYYYHIILDPNNLNVSPLTGALIITY